MTTITGHTTRAPGTVLTAAIYNADHNTHVANAQALNADKLEGATPPTVDGAYAVFDGTSGAALRQSTSTPYVVNGTDVSIADGGTGASTAATAFSNLKQVASDTATGVVEHATVGEIRAAATGNLVITAAILETAAAFVALTDAATVAVDWDAAINFSLTVTANRIIGNPTNGQIGTARRILVQGNDATDRTLTFGANFLGGVPTIIDMDNNKWYMLDIVCITTSHFKVTAVVAKT
jgi:hypothetical protein